jgi:predicted Rossmann fold flavoprotein
METRVCIIGAGPAGLTSAIFASQGGAKAIVLEKNETAGRKLLLTGGGRCNITHSGTVDDFVRAYGPYGRFLRHCLYGFSPEAVQKFFAEIGVATSVDNTGCEPRRVHSHKPNVVYGCVFPVSQRAGDVQDALLRRCRKLGVEFVFGRRVEKIDRASGHFQIRFDSRVITARKIIIATGGVSYPQTGSTGDGYKMAKSLGHTIIEPKAALVPLITDEKWCTDLAGTSLDNVRISAMIDKRGVATTGAIVFTQDGIGGPAVLDLSRLLVGYLPVKILIDIVPAMNETKLEEYLIERISQHSKKVVANALFDLLPKKLAGFLCCLARIAKTPGNQLKKGQRRQLIQLLKKLPLLITAARPIEEATITHGGVSTAEIDSKTMQSRICPGLYFAGEVIDADGPCGGYNLQICWSTGSLAGISAAKR